MSVGNKDWATSDIDLRAAEVERRTGVKLVSSGISEGTVSDRALTFIAPDDIEVLAIGYTAMVSYIRPNQSAGVSLAGRRPRGKSFAISQDDSAPSNFPNVDPDRDEYFIGTVLTMGSSWVHDDTDGAGAGSTGTIGAYDTVFDPGLDSPTGRLVVAEDDAINVHLYQEEDLGVSVEQQYRHILTVWYEEIPEEDTRVRARGEFPSRGSGPTV